ncbi:MAG: hypothetical protein ACRD0G_16410 [Acidimicrobiales bacterium]
MTDLKPGLRLRSAACTTEVVVVRGAGPVDLRCGGTAMVEMDAEATGARIRAPFDTGTLIGKRYVDESGSVELLCTKRGGGSLAIGEAPLEVKAAKPLPSSD